MHSPGRDDFAEERGRNPDNEKYEDGEDAIPRTKRMSEFKISSVRRATDFEPKMLNRTFRGCLGRWDNFGD